MQKWYILYYLIIAKTLKTVFYKYYSEITFIKDRILYIQFVIAVPRSVSI